LDLYLRGGESWVIEDQFRPLDINSNFATYGIRLSHPLVRTIRREIRPSLAFEHRESKNYLLGQGFSFSEHENRGESRFSVLRPGVEWVERRDGAVIVASTTFSGGVSKESFFTWQGRLLWMQRTGLIDSRVHLRGETQLADTSLPPMEKYALGGMYSVRGYRKNVMIKDSGVNASLEWWFPLFRDSVTGSEYLSIAPFFDFGRGWDSGRTTGDAAKGSDLASIGLGLRSTWKDLSVDFFYGYGLIKSDPSYSSDLQDQGIHFMVTWNVL
jgi:hemolysin activation/secretion protein